MGALPSYHTAPQVIVSRPSPSEDGVERETTVSATFDMPMDPATITGDRFSVSGLGGGRGGTVAYDPLTKTATFTPDEPFGAGETISVSLAGEIASLWGLPLGSEVSWIFSIAGATGVAGDDPESLPGGFVLYQNYPNPFNAETRIRFRMNQAGPISLRIYTVTGALVRTLVETDLAAGEYLAVWDGTDRHGKNLASGVYFCRLEASGRLETRRMVLLK